MSNLYNEFIYTNFPDQPYDTYEYMTDLTSDLLELSLQYNSLINSKKFNEAASLLKENPSLNRIYFNAEKYNKLIDSIRATQRLYSEDVRKYILELMSFKGNYNNLQKYIRYNVVKYNSMIYLCITDCPLGTLPTNTAFWIPLTIKGDRGESGIGLSFEQTWSDSKAYNKDACVSYNNCLYASVGDNNLAHTPSVNSEHWSLVVNFNNVTSYDNSSSNLSSTTMQNAIDEVNTKVNTNNTNINTNTSSINTINSKLNGIESGAQVNKVTGIKGDAESSYRTGNINITKANIGLGNVENTPDNTKSVKYAASAGNASTATNASNATNADMVDGFHVTIGTVELEPGVSTLTTNTFYFMYE